MNQTRPLSSGSDKMKSFPIFVMNSHHNLQAYSCIIIVIVVGDAVLALLEGYASTSMIWMVLLTIATCTLESIRKMKKNTEISNLLIFWLWLIIYIQLHDNIHIVPFVEAVMIIIGLIKGISVFVNTYGKLTFQLYDADTDGYAVAKNIAFHEIIFVQELIIDDVAMQ